MSKISLKKLIAPSFYSIHNDLKQNKYTHYWLKGGRGSTKSSFASIEIILGIMKDGRKGNYTNAVILRKVKDTLHDSVFEQLGWAIQKLEVSQLWHIPQSKLELTYIPTGQKILFRGADKPKKIKSTKVKKGYIKYIWYEEVDEFRGMEEIRTINQSLMRGGETFVNFYTYNPPESIRNWVNNEVLNQREDRKVHDSNYLQVPKEWLGPQFLIEAEHLKKVNPKAYNHEYLGEVTGTGGEVFTNVTVRKITDNEIKQFDNIRRGLDWGYAADPFYYGVMHYDKTRRRLYIFHEIYKVGLSNRRSAELIKKYPIREGYIIADSAEPKSIDEMKTYGIKIKGAKKGPGSIEYGIRFLSKEIEEIIIDNERCPNTAKEFLGYELEKDRNGEFKANYPDKNNHSIDGIRYALENDMSQASISVLR